MVSILKQVGITIGNKWARFLEFKKMLDALSEHEFNELVNIVTLASKK